MKSTRAEWIGRVYELGSQHEALDAGPNGVGRGGMAGHGTRRWVVGMGVGRTPGLGLLTRRTG